MIFGATNAFNASTSYDLISRLLVIIVLGGMGSLGGALLAGILHGHPGGHRRGGVVARVVDHRLLHRPGRRPVDSPPGPLRQAVSEDRLVRQKKNLLWLAALVAIWPSSCPLITEPRVPSTIAVGHPHLHGVRHVVEHVLGLLGLRRARFGGLLRHRRLHHGACCRCTCTCPRAATCSGSCPSADCAPMVVAVPVGLIALRVRRHTFVVITIAIFFVFQLAGHQLQLHRRHGADCSLPSSRG